MSQPQTIAQPVPPAQAAQQQPPKPRNRTWDENYAQLLVYKAQHGHCDVPLNHKNDRVLGKWVAHLRENCNQSSLSTERREALNAIGFNWNPHEQKWMEMFQRLQGFKKSEGHCKVPTNWKPDKKLGKWVMRQREKRKNGILPDARREALESIGFVWKVHKVEQNKETRKTQHVDEKWQERYQSLVKFEKENGHCNVPKVYDKDPQLGKWVQEQRVMYQRNLLKAERKKLLEDIGFIFSYRAQKIQQDWNQIV
ncbi:helicase [Seminavis robusta]|uniref:Helicase n=1 Tax=Seminavis robusta TaxID=568900 RepID=A0A9N8HZI6_9STRA|nr:helicase [Seminavis robusta]|eukprot:Sro2923_g340340.1 helicase (253) ;mRNA; f:9523-10281